MVFIEHFHGHDVIRPLPAKSRVLAAPTESGEDPGEFPNIVIGISWNRVAVGVVLI